MTKDNVKKLTGAELKKQVKALEEQGEFTVDIGGQKYKLQYDIHIKKTKEIKLIEDLIAFFSYGAENATILEYATPYTALLVIKHFTSLEVSDDIEEAIILLGILIDLEVLDKIVDSLPEENVERIFKILADTLNNITENIEIEEEVQSTFESLKKGE